MTRNTPEQIRDKLLNAAGEVKAFKEKILALAKDLPRVTDEELEEEEEETLEGNLLGMLECLVTDNLDPAIVKLESVLELGPPAADAADVAAEGRGEAKPPKITPER
jgi:hypothetical protein